MPREAASWVEREQRQSRRGKGEEIGSSFPRFILSIFVPRLSRFGGRLHIVEPFGSDLQLQTID
jgi:hypothetical protein